MLKWENCVFYFLLFSFLGWVVEEAITSFENKRFVNVGYLNGPFCPTYGFSVVMCYIISELIIKEWYAQLIIFTVVVSVFVFFTGVFLKKVLHCRVWDYSGMSLNIKGFITVPLSIMWGIVLTILIEYIMPVFDYLIGYVPRTIVLFTIAVLGSILLIDTVVTTVSYFEVRIKVKRLNSISEKLYKISQGWGRAVAKASIKTGENLGIDEKIDEYQTKVEIAKNRSTFNDKEIEEIKEELDVKYEKLLSDNGFFERQAVKAMDSSSIENDQQLKNLYDRIVKGTRQLNRREYNGYFRSEKEKPFAYGVNFYKLFWLFVIGSFIGCIMETAVGFATNGGRFEYRVGLVHGPFIPVYGIGAVMMTLALYKFSNARMWVIFLVSAVVGATFEYITSYFQQLLFGSISWDYSYQKFNLYGRTSLYYAIIWGVLGIAWAKFIYPFVSMLIEKLPKKMGKILTIVLCVFMVYNCAVSCLAQWRYNERQDGVPATNIIEKFLDKQFTDEYLDMIYPNMRHLED